MADTVKFYSDDRVISDTSIDTRFNHLETLKLNDDEKFREFFETDRVIKWINESEYKRVALQLPDGFLKYAFRLASTIESQCSNSKIYVLADTSYRSCCVDDVAAQHANCDSLVHYGESCLSKTSERMPILYVFGDFPVDLDDFRQKWNDFADNTDLKEHKIYLLCDSIFAHSQGELKAILQRKVVSYELASTSSDVVDISLGRILPKQQDDEKKTLLVFIGTENSPLLSIWLMTFPKVGEYVHYAPDLKSLTHESSPSHRLLRKRLFLVEKLRDAKVVGLVVGALEIKGYNEAIKRVRQLCKAANKKLYVFSIGKLNEAKLSNFSGDIDAFVVISCPFGVVLDASDFYKPILSMFEAEIALNSGKDWFASEGWTAEFGQFLSDEIKKEDAEKTDVSLITGKVRGSQFVESNEGDAKNHQVVEYSAGDYFANRSWKGLDDTYNKDDTTELKEGLKGISLGYSSEKQK